MTVSDITNLVACGQKETPTAGANKNCCPINDRAAAKETAANVERPELLCS